MCEVGEKRRHSADFATASSNNPTSSSWYGNNLGSSIFRVKCVRYKGDSPHTRRSFHQKNEQDLARTGYRLPCPPDLHNVDLFVTRNKLSVPPPPPPQFVFLLHVPYNRKAFLRFPHSQTPTTRRGPRQPTRRQNKRKLAAR